MIRRLIGGVLAAALVLTGYAPTVLAADTSLLLSQGAAFAILGHSCGGIQEKAFATGFDVNGDPTGDVYMQTRCGGSGRGGGYHTTTYWKWAVVSWDFAGNAVSTSVLATVPTVDPTFSQSDGSGDTVYNAANHAFLSVALPSAPTGVTAASSAGQYLVSWDASSSTPSTVSFTVTATPGAPSTAPIVTQDAAGTATSALIGPLEPLTDYLIVVSSTNAAGTGPDSSPAVPISTPASTQPPGAPTGVKAIWSSDTTLFATWNAAAQGDSPIDSYKIRVSPYGADAPVPLAHSRTVAADPLSTSFTLNSVDDWKVQVRAHNAAGWGPWSKAVILGGL